MIIENIELKYRCHLKGEIARAKIINLVERNIELNITDLSKIMKLSWPTIDFHVKFLESIGVVKTEYYKGNKKRGAPSKLVSLV